MAGVRYPALYRWPALHQCYRPIRQTLAHAAKLVFNALYAALPQQSMRWINAISKEVQRSPGMLANWKYLRLAVCFQPQSRQQELFDALSCFSEMRLVVTHNNEVIHISTVVALVQFVLYESIQFIQVHICKKLTGQITQWNADTWTARA